VKDERGSAPLDIVFSIAFLFLLGLGVMQVALTLYGRNTLISATHESARAAVELARTEDEIEIVAKQHAHDGAGGLVKDMTVDVEVTKEQGQSFVTVSVRAKVGALGPLPVLIPVETHAIAEFDEVVFDEV
jgi:hypothetical protein